MQSRFALSTVLKAVLAVLSVVLVTCVTFAQDVPHKVSYQGLLTDGSGVNPIQDGDHVATFTLYTDAAGTTSFWSSTFHLTTSKGIFNVVLGDSGAPLPTPLMMPLWLGVSVENGPELRPLTQVVSAPYALGIADSTVSTNKLQNSSVTANKIAQDFVGRVTLNRAQFQTQKGKDIDFVVGRNLNLSVDTTNGQVHAIIDALGGGTLNEVRVDPAGGLTITQSGNSFVTLAIASQGVQTYMIKDKSVTNVKLADGAVDSRTILDGSITGTDIASNTITGNNIRNNTITGVNIAIPLVLTRSTPGDVLDVDNTSDNIGGLPVVHFHSTQSSDGTPVMLLDGRIVGGPVLRINQISTGSTGLEANSAGGPGVRGTTTLTSNPSVGDQANGVEGIASTAANGATGVAGFANNAASSTQYGVVGATNANGSSSAGVSGVYNGTTNTGAGVLGTGNAGWGVNATSAGRSAIKGTTSAAGWGGLHAANTAANGGIAVLADVGGANSTGVVVGLPGSTAPATGLGVPATGVTVNATGVGVGISNGVGTGLQVGTTTTAGATFGATAGTSNVTVGAAATNGILVNGSSPVGVAVQTNAATGTGISVTNAGTTGIAVSGQAANAVGVNIAEATGGTGVTTTGGAIGHSSTGQTGSSYVGSNTSASATAAMANTGTGAALTATNNSTTAATGAFVNNGATVAGMPAAVNPNGSIAAANNNGAAPTISAYNANTAINAANGGVARFYNSNNFGKNQSTLTLTNTINGAPSNNYALVVTDGLVDFSNPNTTVIAPNMAAQVTVVTNPTNPAPANGVLVTATGITGAAYAATSAVPTGVSVTGATATGYSTTGAATGASISATTTGISVVAPTGMQVTGSANAVKIDGGTNGLVVGSATPVSGNAINATNSSAGSATATFANNGSNGTAIAVTSGNVNVSTNTNSFFGPTAGATDFTRMTVTGIASTQTLPPAPFVNTNNYELVVTGDANITGTTNMNNAIAANMSITNTLTMPPGSTATFDILNVNQTLNSKGNTNIGDGVGSDLLTVASNTTSNFNGPTNTLGALTATGVTNVNSTGSNNTFIGNLNSTTAITGPTNVNTSGTATTTIGSAAGTTNVNGTTTVTGNTNINITGTGATTIGNVTNGGAVTLNTTPANAISATGGNMSFTSTGATGLGNISITASGTGGNAVAINNAGNASTNIGNASSTTNVTGPTNINTGSSTSTTTIGNAGAGVAIISNNALTNGWSVSASGNLTTAGNNTLGVTATSVNNINGASTVTGNGSATALTVAGGNSTALNITQGAGAANTAFTISTVGGTARAMDVKQGDVFLGGNGATGSPYPGINNPNKTMTHDLYVDGQLTLMGTSNFAVITTKSPAITGTSQQQGGIGVRGVSHPNIALNVPGAGVMGFALDPTPFDGSIESNSNPTAGFLNPPAITGVYGYVENANYTGAFFENSNKGGPTLDYATAVTALSRNNTATPANGRGILVTTPNNTDKLFTGVEVKAPSGLNGEIMRAFYVNSNGSGVGGGSLIDTGLVIDPVIYGIDVRAGLTSVTNDYGLRIGQTDAQILDDGIIVNGAYPAGGSTTRGMVVQSDAGTAMTHGVKVGFAPSQNAWTGNAPSNGVDVRFAGNNTATPAVGVPGGSTTGNFGVRTNTTVAGGAGVVAGDAFGSASNVLTEGAVVNASSVGVRIGTQFNSTTPTNEMTTAQNANTPNVGSMITVNPSVNNNSGIGVTTTTANGAGLLLKGYEAVNAAGNITNGVNVQTTAGGTIGAGAGNAGVNVQTTGGTNAQIGTGVRVNGNSTAGTAIVTGVDVQAPNGGNIGTGANIQIPSASAGTIVNQGVNVQTFTGQINQGVRVTNASVSNNGIVQGVVVSNTDATAIAEANSINHGVDVLTSGNLHDIGTGFNAQVAGTSKIGTGVNVQAVSGNGTFGIDTGFIAQTTSGSINNGVVVQTSTGTIVNGLTAQNTGNGTITTGVRVQTANTAASSIGTGVLVNAPTAGVNANAINKGVTISTGTSSNINTGVEVVPGGVVNTGVNVNNVNGAAGFGYVSNPATTGTSTGMQLGFTTPFNEGAWIRTNTNNSTSAYANNTVYALNNFSPAANDNAAAMVAAIGTGASVAAQNILTYTAAATTLMGGGTPDHSTAVFAQGNNRIAGTFGNNSATYPTVYGQNNAAGGVVFMGTSSGIPVIGVTSGAYPTATGVEGISTMTANGSGSVGVNGASQMADGAANNKAAGVYGVLTSGIPTNEALPANAYAGVIGTTGSTNAVAANTMVGVLGLDRNSTAVTLATGTATRFGVYGVTAGATTADAGVAGEAPATAGTSFRARSNGASASSYTGYAATTMTNGVGVDIAASSTATGVSARVNGASAYSGAQGTTAIVGLNNATNAGVVGLSGLTATSTLEGSGVIGQTATDGGFGVRGTNSGAGTNVVGVQGTTTAAGTNVIGVQGTVAASGTNRVGVEGILTTGGTKNYGVLGTPAAGTYLSQIATAEVAGVTTSATVPAVAAEADVLSGTALQVNATNAGANTGANTGIKVTANGDATGTTYGVNVGVATTGAASKAYGVNVATNGPTTFSASIPNSAGVYVDVSNGAAVGATTGIFVKGTTGASNFIPGTGVGMIVDPFPTGLSVDATTTGAFFATDVDGTAGTTGIIVGPAGANRPQTGLNVNANNSASANGAMFNVSGAGVNTGAYFNVTGGTNNYAMDVAAGDVRFVNSTTFFSQSATPTMFVGKIGGAGRTDLNVDGTGTFGVGAAFDVIGASAANDIAASDNNLNVMGATAASQVNIQVGDSTSSPGRVKITDGNSNSGGLITADLTAYQQWTLPNISGTVGVFPSPAVSGFVYFEPSGVYDPQVATAGTRKLVSMQGLATTTEGVKIDLSTNANTTAGTVNAFEGNVTAGVATTNVPQILAGTVQSFTSGTAATTGINVTAQTNGATGAVTGSSITARNLSAANANLIGQFVTATNNTFANTGTVTGSKVSALGHTTSTGVIGVDASASGSSTANTAFNANVTGAATTNFGASLSVSGATTNIGEDINAGGATSYGLRIGATTPSMTAIQVNAGNAGTATTGLEVKNLGSSANSRAISLAWNTGTNLPNTNSGIFIDFSGAPAASAGIGMNITNLRGNTGVAIGMTAAGGGTGIGITGVDNQTGISVSGVGNSGYGISSTYGADATSGAAILGTSNGTAKSNAAIRAVGNNPSAPGTLQAAALDIQGGGVLSTSQGHTGNPSLATVSLRVADTYFISGAQAGAGAAVISNNLITGTSTIIVTIQSGGAGPHDPYIVSQAGGTMTVNFSGCAAGDAIHYIVINH